MQSIKTINFENYTVKSYLQTFGQNCIQFKLIDDLNTNNMLLHCLVQTYKNNVLVDVYNSGYIIVQQDDNTYCVLLGDSVAQENSDLITCINYVARNAY